MGAHTLIGEPEAALSPSPSVSQPGFCDVVGTIDDYVKNGPSDVGPALSQIDESKGNDPAVLAAIRAQGQPMIDYTNTVAAYMRHAGSLADDRAAAEAFASLADAVETEGQIFGLMALNATSVEDYVTQATEKIAEPDYLALQAQGQKANATVVEYALSECGLDISAPGPEERAQTDASMLGTEIAHYFVDWNDGDALPAISVDLGKYYIDAAGQKNGEEVSIHTSLGAVSSDVVLIDQAITSPVDWCVSVGLEDQEDVAFRYSAAGGLEDGVCVEPPDASPGN